MSANTETTGAPEGYVECPKKCGRWMYQTNITCWPCWSAATGKQPTTANLLERPDWTPPIAAPADHVERRKGQRWKSERRFSSGLLIVTGTLGERMESGDGWKLIDVERNDGITYDSCFMDCSWSRAEDNMTLLADAPPEAEEPCGSECGRAFPTVARCEEHEAACAKCKALSEPPAQEAPKAAPTCSVKPYPHNDAAPSAECGDGRCGYRPFRDSAPCVLPADHVISGRSHCTTACANGRDCKTPTALVLMRVLRDERQPLCDACYLGVEGNLESLMDFEQTGKPYAGPTRLPKPQLAADWVEDCLGDVR